MIGISIPMIFRGRKRVQTGNINNINSDPDNADPVITKYKIVIAIFFGILSGTMAKLFGISGTSPIIACLYILGYAVSIVVGTSVFIFLFNTVSGLFGHLMVGQFDLLLIVLLGADAALCKYVKPKLIPKVKIAALNEYMPRYSSP